MRDIYNFLLSRLYFCRFDREVRKTCMMRGGFCSFNVGGFLVYWNEAGGMEDVDMSEVRAHF